MRRKMCGTKETNQILHYSLDNKLYFKQLKGLFANFVVIQALLERFNATTSNYSKQIPESQSEYVNRIKARAVSHMGTDIGSYTSHHNITVRHKPTVDDIHYNRNFINKLISQGVDVSNFIIVEDNYRKSKTTFLK